MHTSIYLAAGLRIGSAVAQQWQPEVGSTWQIVLERGIVIPEGATTISPDVSIFDIDLYDNTDDGTDRDRIIGRLHGLGKRVICYFSAGTYEPGRPDSGNFTEEDQGAVLPDWPDERWLDIRRDTVREIILARIDVAADMGCDGIDPDNMDGFDNENGGGFPEPLIEQDSIDFMQLMATRAESHNMAIGLKNALSIIPSVVGITQFAVNEECSQFGEGGECGEIQPYIEAGKPVFHIEYPEGAGEAGGVPEDVRQAHCEPGGTEGFSTVLKTGDLNGWVQFCDGQIFETPMEN